MNAPDDLVRYALAYAKRGWKVLPLHSVTNGVCSCGCTGRSAGKHPRSEHGLKDATDGWRVIVRWWERWPDANVGLAMSGRFWVLDLDGPEGIQRWADLQLLHGACPETFAVRTGNGIHLYFLRPEGMDIRNKQDCPHCPHIDRRANGGYVVAPPSMHYSGRRYEVLSKVQAVKAPEWVHHIWDPPPRETPLPPPAPPVVVSQLDRARRYVQAVLQGVCNDIRSAGCNGGKFLHNTVYTKAALIGSYASGGYIDDVYAIQALMAAALEAKPNGKREMERAVTQGYEKGSATPMHPRLEERP